MSAHNVVSLVLYCTASLFVNPFKKFTILIISSIFPICPAITIADESSENPAYRPTLNPVELRPATHHDSVALVRDGKPIAVIVVARDMLAQSTSVPMVAAHEFNEHLKLAAGVTLPIVGDHNAPEHGTLLLIGRSDLTRRLGLNPGNLPPEGFEVQTFVSDGLRGMAVIGDDTDTTRMQFTTHGDIANRAILFGVYDVLERFLGVRWYYPGQDGRVVPETKQLIIPAVRYRDWPRSTKRTFHPWSVKPDVPGVTNQQEYWLHACRNREGASAVPRLTPCHSPIFQNHFKDHPECYELRADGHRDPTMPCYSEPETINLLVQDVVNFYEHGDKGAWRRPDGSYWYPPTDRVICISPPDKSVECHCPRCQALMNPGAPRLARASRVMTQFVIAFANRIHAIYPDKYVWYLPYSNYTIAPEDVELPDNVIVGLCMMRGAANMKEPVCAREHDQWIEQWRRASSNPLQLWDYGCWPANDTALPFQYPHVLQDFQLRHEGQLAGSFIGAGLAPPDLPGRQWASQAPTFYCWMRLLWNPHFNIDAAWDEYIKLMYGPAQKPMGQIFNLLVTRWENVRWTTPPNGHTVSPTLIHEQTMPAEEAAKLGRWITEARELAGKNNLYQRRVDFIGRSVDLFLTESKNYHAPANLPTLTLLKVGDDPQIDGKLDESAWSDTQAQSFVLARSGDQPAVGSRVRGVWTSRGVSFAFELNEPHMDRLHIEHTAHDAAVFNDDCVELFLDVAGDRLTYYQFAINAGGFIFDAFNQSGSDWNASGVLVATSRGENGWVLEMFIPFATFKDYKTPRVGDQWYGNFTRHRLTVDAEHERFQRWSTRGRASNLDMTAFGQLRFIE